MALTDVCLILEGSYPYVVGGVSTWTHHLIKALPDIDFSIVYVGVSKHQVQKMEYRLPENVKQFNEIYLLDPVIVKGSGKGFKRAAWKRVEEFVDRLERGDSSGFHAVAEALTAGDDPAITPYDILYSRRFWDIMVGVYRRNFPNLSFLDFFWTCRFLMLPLFQLLYSPIPEAKVYHATCTGYAGLLGALGHRRYGSPLVLTEHGIYTKERMIEIAQAAYIYNEVVVDYVPRRELGLLQNLWMSKFKMLAEIAYNESDAIITLYGGNQKTQIQHGAPAEKCTIIPNGIEVARYAELVQNSPPKDPGYHVAFVGRISPIKDPKTFIRAARAVVDRLPTSTFYLLGTPDEDVDYYEECRSLAELLELGDRLKFMGSVDMSQWYPKLDLVLLTSVSEAQPFVIIEAMAVGVPCVATNVGACSELLFGGTDEDRRLGSAGVVTNVNSPEETAKAVIALLEDTETRKKMAQVGRERSFRYYQRQSVVNRYRDVYRELIAKREAGGMLGPMAVTGTNPTVRAATAPGRGF
jgi:glycosyltransferase involved in cell wall biosynthesis